MYLSKCCVFLRLEQLETLFIHKNNLTYLPQCLANISTLKMVVVSGDELTCLPSKLCRSPEIKYENCTDTKSSLGPVRAEGNFSICRSCLHDNSFGKNGNVFKKLVFT